MKRVILLIILIGITAGLTTGCSVVAALRPTATPTSTMIPTPTATPLPPTPTPTPTEEPVFVDAIYFSGELQVPILIYHRFIPDDFGPTTATKMQLSEFTRELQEFYDNGYSLISLKSWIDGTFVVPAGRKPLVITLDDLWFADQIYLDETGTPSELSGIGLLWKFSRENPDFGFQAALFSNMGDKYYADRQVLDRFIIGEGDAWKDKLGNTIAWAIDNQLEPYNHLYQHPKLDITQNKHIQYQIEENDNITRYFLKRVGREDLIPSLDNVIALPFGIWPVDQAGKDILLRYVNPEGKTLLAVMEAYNLDAKQFTPSYFSESFNPFAIARITASQYMTEFIVENKDLVPTAQVCHLGPAGQAEIEDPEVLGRHILDAIQSGTCADGVYHASGYIFLARGGVFTIHSSPGEDVTAGGVSSDSTPVP